RSPAPTITWHPSSTRPTPGLLDKLRGVSQKWGKLMVGGGSVEGKEVSPLVGLALVGSGSLGMVPGPMAGAHAAAAPAAAPAHHALACNLSNVGCIIISGILHLECVSGVVNACV